MFSSVGTQVEDEQGVSNERSLDEPLEVTEFWKPLEGQANRNGDVVSKAERVQNRAAYEAASDNFEPGTFVLYDRGVLQVSCKTRVEMNCAIVEADPPFTPNYFWTIAGFEDRAHATAHVATTKSRDQ